MAMSATRVLPAASPLRSLCWSGDALIDWAGGAVRYELDGSHSRATLNLMYRFDRAIASEDGRYVVVYELLGTAGLILRDGKVLREIRRSAYCADRFEYPVALTTLPSGRTVLAHCPDRVSRLELEDLDSGERLTRRQGRAIEHFFSRLQFSDNGRYLVSAGWVWSPLHVARVIDVQRAIESPESMDLDNQLELPDAWEDEVAGADFGSGAELLLCGGEPYEPPPSAPVFPRSIGLYRVETRRLERRVPLAEPEGRLMPLGELAVGFHRHPKLIDLRTGEVVRRWPEIETGDQLGSIRSEGVGPPLALDAKHRRFAVGTKEGIQVVEL